VTQRIRSSIIEHSFQKPDRPRELRAVFFFFIL
jgi:hypothetical protein